MLAPLMGWIRHTHAGGFWENELDTWLCTFWDFVCKPKGLVWGEAFGPLLYDSCGWQLEILCAWIGKGLMCEIRQLCWDCESPTFSMVMYFGCGDWVLVCLGLCMWYVELLGFSILFLCWAWEAIQSSNVWYLCKQVAGLLCARWVGSKPQGRLSYRGAPLWLSPNSFWCPLIEDLSWQPSVHNEEN